MKINNSLTAILCVMTLTLWSGAVRAVDAPTPFYSVTGTNGTGGGTAGISVTPVNAPSGSTALTDLAASGLFSFGIGSDQLPGGSISNAATGQAGNQCLAGTLGVGGVLSNFTMTVWFMQPSAAINNYRLGLISAGAPANTSKADGGSENNGNKMFWGENSGGGFQFYVNSYNGNSVGTSIAGPNTWNNSGTLGAIQLGTWYFVAITYHIDSNSASNKCVLYSGSQSNTCVQAATYTGDANGLGGPLDLSAATSICLMNRFSGGRCFPGEMDYFNLYTNVLTVDQLTAVQNSEQPQRHFPNPSISISPTNTFFALSPSVGIFTVAGNGADPMYYQWLTDGGSGGALTNIPGATNTTLDFNITNAGTYTYSCVVSNSFTVSGGTASPMLPVYVLPASVPQLTSDMNSSGTLFITNVYSFIGGSAGFNAAFGLGTLPITNQWIADTGSGYAPIAGATGNTLTVTNIQTSLAGNYELAATNQIGGANSTPGHLTVLARPGAPTDVYGHCVMTNHPWAYWRFEETNDSLTSSMQAYDYSGSNYDATYGNSDGTPGSGCKDGGESLPQYGPIPSGSYSGFTSTNMCASLSYNHNNGYLYVPPLNLNTNTVTFMMWIYPKSATLPTSTGLFMNRNGSDAAGIGFGAVTNGNQTPCLAYTWNNNSSATYGWNSGLFPVANVWNFVACTITPSNTVLYLYYAIPGNGTNLYKAVNNLTNAVEAFNGGTTWMGSDNFNNGRTFYGCIDEVAIFTNSLTEAQVQNIFLKALGGISGVAPTFQNQPTPASQYVLGGQTIQLSASGGGSPYPTYNWQSSPDGTTWTTLADGAGITGSHTNILTYTMGNNALDFRVFLANPYGSVTSSVVVVNVNPIPTGLWTVNFQFTNNYAGSGLLGLGRFTGYGILGSGTYWNSIPNPGSAAGTFTSTSDLLDDGATHSGVVATHVSGGGFSSVNGAAVAPNILLDAYSQIYTTTATGNLLFTHVPSGRYNLVLYGIDGTFADRGTVFTVNGVSQTTSNVQAAVYVQGDNVVLYTNVLVTNGILSVNINANPNIALYGNTNWEGSFNGAQLQLTTAGPNIWSITNSGTNLVLAWAGGGLMQSTNLSAGAGWVTNTAVSPYTFAPTGAQRFFRIVNYHFP